jgi:AraC family transcriptional regulator, regulatory protein of adaptative response / methylated-DNA-[protein]-cysteine methyltransferase
MNRVDNDLSPRSRPSPARRSAERDIEYSVGTSALGQVLVAQGAVGVCAILIGSTIEELKQELAESFPSCKLAPNDLKLRKDLAKVIRFIAEPSHRLDLVLEMRGTAFQRRVWNALCDIPVGVTVTYAELARRIGEPRSVRAVASACAANPIALAVPCHRVLRSDGSLSAYRWGVERKRALINKEAMA